MMDMIEKAALKNQREKETYRDNDGTLRCCACGEPVERYIQVLREKRPVACRCDREAEEGEKRRAAREAAARAAKKSPLYDAAYNRFTFERDTAPDCDASRRCRAYVAHWEEMEVGSYGILFAGPLGVGKSYYAAAVVNALRDKGISALIVTTSRLINAIRAAKDPQKVIDDLNRFRFVVLDDLGAERDTEYAVEQLEGFINCRSNMEKRPLAVTTNLLRKELDNPQNIGYARIFDRVKQMCCLPIVLTGPSRRAEQAKERGERCKQLLGI